MGDAEGGVRLDLKTVLDAGVCTIQISGELDAGEVAKVQDALRKAESSAEVSEIVLDIRRLEFIDSSGIAMLGFAAKRDTEARLRVTGSTSQVERLLTLTGMADLLRREA